MQDLTAEVIAFLKDNGASVVGIAGADRFDDLPPGHRPRDYLPAAASVVSYGVALLHQSLYWEEHLRGSELVPEENREDVLQNYYYRQTGYAMVNNLLDMLALRLANMLEARGYRSMYFPATYGTQAIWRFINAKIPSRAGLFSQRHAAVRAGLGEFGLNNMVVTPEFGPRIRFNSVITAAALVPDRLLDRKVCLGESCSLCLEKCPGAMSVIGDSAPDGMWYDSPTRTDTNACVRLSLTRSCLGRCMKVCPVGRRRPVANNG